MMARILHKLLTVFLTSSLCLATDGAKAQDAPPLKTLSASECMDKSLQCSCYTPPALEKIATEIKSADALRYELAQYKELSKSIEEKAWYNDSTLYYSALILTAVVGGVVGYSVGN